MLALAVAAYAIVSSAATATRRPISSASAFRLPSAAQCVSGRTLTVRLRRVPGVRWRNATVKIDGKRVETIAPRQAGKPVRLLRLPRRRFVLSLKAKAADGRTVTARRTYRPCGAASPREVASQLGALADSPATRSALRDLSDAVSSPAVTRFTQSVVAQYGAELPAFDKQLLDLTSLLEHPQNQKLFDALRAGRRLTHAQAKRLASLRADVRKNPAIVQLTAAGRRLQKHPAELASALKAAIDQPPSPSISSTGDPDFDPAASSLSRALNTAPQKALADRTRKILSGPGAVAFVQTLPPLLVASLAPPISARAAGITCRTDFALTKLKVLWDVGKDVTDYLLISRFLTISDFLAPAFTNDVAGLVKKFTTDQDLGTHIYAAYQTFRPVSLVLCRAGDSIVAGTTQSYAVEGVGFEGQDVGPVRGARLSIIPDGSCDAF
ncbi:MAG: hypothetical protein QOF58_1699, partial [Pseudonocardiales bacterium]|nr:hypothetical protein [Pseudonocardiales bacterium]